MQQLILASASPRRRELLSLLGLEFEVVATGVEELTEGEPAVLVVENALRKARARGQARRRGPRGRHRCRPRRPPARQARATPLQARARIRALAGRTHVVLSGLALVAADESRTELVRTEVTFRELTDREVEAYVESGEWRDRAGGYAVQGLGSSLVAAIDGDLSNVIGLPLPALAEMIAKLQDP